jgi:hypothetical protein
MQRIKKAEVRETIVFKEGTTASAFITGADNAPEFGRKNGLCASHDPKPVAAS